MNARELGGRGESIACEYLVKNGYKILGRNYRVKFGEIDIIACKKLKLFAKDDKTIHFIEVKTVAGSPSVNSEQVFFPEDKVNYKKKKKLVRLAEIWLIKNGFLQNYPCQIDVIGIVAREVRGESEICHFENVAEDF